MAAGIGYLLAAWLAVPAFQVAVGVGFIVMAAGTLIAKGAYLFDFWVLYGHFF